jgi:hypothetical protein
MPHRKDGARRPVGLLRRRVFAHVGLGKPAGRYCDMARAGVGQKNGFAAVITSIDLSLALFRAAT